MMRTLPLTCVALLTVACSPAETAGGGTPPCDHPGTFQSAGKLLTPRYNHAAVTLASGKVLVVGGEDDHGVLTSAELFDPATKTFSATGDLSGDRRFPAVFPLPSGQAMIAGGFHTSGALFPNVEIYDAESGEFSPGASWITPRTGFASVQLSSGELLFFGGKDGSGAVLASVERYDPLTRQLAALAPMTTARAGCTATPLASGKILIAGGVGAKELCGPPCSHEIIASAEVYDPATGTSTPTGSLIHELADHTAISLPTGDVLVLGGAFYGESTPSAELYDASQGTFSAAAAPSDLHVVPLLLRSGEVLVTGGVGTDGTPSVAAELYDAAKGTFTATGSMATGHSAAPPALLSNGSVLVAGGVKAGMTDYYAGVEVYCPAAGN